MMTRLRYAHRLLLLLLLLLTVAACDSTSSTDALPRIEAFDTWTVGTPASQDLDAETLGRLTATLQGGDFGAVKSLLIARNGFLVYEEYFRGATQDGLHQVYSVTKSITSALVGLAVAEGHIDHVDQPLLGFFPEYELTLNNKSAQKSRISLEHVLNMQAGLEWDEWSTPYSNPQNPTALLAGSPDWMKFMLDLPMTSEPGTQFTYNSGATMLLSGILQRTTGQTAEAYAVDALFTPLGIDRYSWRDGPDDITNTGWGLFLTSRDMARFGHLYLMDGRWGRRQLIPQAWRDVLATPAAMLNGSTGYTYQWWLMPDPDGSGFIPYAEGYGGQFIVVVPSLDLVVVSTAENFTSTTDIRRILREFVFPAVD